MDDAETVAYDKLVRDGIPEIIETDGEDPVTHRATGEEYRRRLHDKLDEEVAEFREEPTAEELADVVTVLHALRKCHDIDEETVERVRREKADERGTFDDGVVLDAVRR